MIFYLHYILLTSGLSGTSVLLGVFFSAYSDASQGEIGILLMTFPFVSIVIKPLFCSMADRSQSHRIYLILALVIMLIGYAPFAIVPFFPLFYENHPRLSWYLLVVACHVGNGGLGVAWSLGDTLAVNMSQKKGTPYSRMRLMGTISWGVYGYIIGQINEVPYLPKYVPAFVILNVSVLTEIFVLMCWNKEDFMMFDPTQEILNNLDSEQQQQQQQQTPQSTLTRGLKLVKVASNGSCGTLTNTNNATTSSGYAQTQRDIDSTPSSLGGTLRLSSKTATVLRDIIAAEDISKQLKIIEQQSSTVDEEEFESKEDNNNNNNNNNVFKQTTKTLEVKQQQQPYQWASIGDCEKNIISNKQKQVEEEEENHHQKNPQFIIFKLILKEDGRLIKYLILFTVFGAIMSPMNFVFLSFVDVCKERGYNFSQLAGSVLISQATIETLSFLVMPWFLNRVSRPAALAFGLMIYAIRYFFYAGFYYTSDISPYWALVGEWCHGISYGIFCTILADMALMFASQSKLFIPELRTMGYLSKSGSEKKIRAEEQAIQMALRATMQAVFGGFMDGLGQGLGNLICGIVVEAYNYIKLWQLFTVISASSCVLYHLVEITKCRFSDSYRPEKGTKAFEIMSLTVGGDNKDSDGGGGGGAEMIKAQPTKTTTISNKVVELVTTST